MFKTFFAIMLTVLGLATQLNAQPEKKLAEAFVQSVAKNNFQILSPYLVNIAAAKKLFGAEFSKLPAAKHDETIKKFNKTLNTKWSAVVANAEKNNVDFSKLKINSIKLSEIKDAPLYSSVLVTYMYNGVEWDDLLLFVNRQGTQKYLLEIPLTTYMFTFNDQRRGKNLEEIENTKDKIADIKYRLQEEVQKIKELADANKDSALASKIIYRGDEDKATRWKRPLDPTSATDFELAKEWIKKIKSGLGNCPDLKFGDVRVEKESEGTWHVLQVICGNKKFHYAFLKVNGLFALGDIDEHD